MEIDLRAAVQRAVGAVTVDELQHALGVDEQHDGGTPGHHLNGRGGQGKFPFGASEPVVRRGKLARYRLGRGDRARLITGTGGGYGEPFERDPARVRDDVRDQTLTLAQAAKIYGVVIDPATLAVEWQATRGLRERAKRTRVSP